MAKPEEKVKWGTKLEWATRSGHETKEFWGAHHFENAQMEYAAQKEILGEKMYWHQFHSMNTMPVEKRV